MSTMKFQIGRSHDTSVSITKIIGRMMDIDDTDSQPQV